MKIIIDSENKLNYSINYLQALNLSKSYVLSCTVLRDTRTTNQNSLYWLWLACLSEETGHTKDELHSFFKNKFLSKNKINVLGEEINDVPSTTKLDTKQFSEYLDKIKEFAFENLGIRLPVPEDIIFEEFYKTYITKL